MSELIQVKKSLTFEEICPLWADRIKRGDLIGREGCTDIHNASRCVVGEAYKFSEVPPYMRGYDNYCECCLDYSRLFCLNVVPP